jgi:hypothetical protein
VPKLIWIIVFKNEEIVGAEVPEKHQHNGNGLAQVEIKQQLLVKKINKPGV